jgi:hypothetical protein
MKEIVYYCPECDGIHVRPEDNAYLFKNENGPFIMVWEKPLTGDLGVSFKLHNLYLVGEL